MMELKNKFLRAADFGDAQRIIQHSALPGDIFKFVLLNEFDLQQRIMAKATAGFTPPGNTQDHCLSCKCCPKNLKDNEKLFLFYTDRETKKRFPIAVEPKCIKTLQ